MRLPIAAVLLLALAGCDHDSRPSGTTIDPAVGVVFRVEPALRGSYSGTWASCRDSIPLDGSKATHYWLPECGKVRVEIDFTGGPGCVRFLSREIDGLLLCGDQVDRAVFPRTGYVGNGGE